MGAGGTTTVWGGSRETGPVGEPQQLNDSTTTIEMTIGS
jgi:hypothetical protein